MHGRFLLVEGGCSKRRSVRRGFPCVVDRVDFMDDMDLRSDDGGGIYLIRRVFYVVIHDHADRRFFGVTIAFLFI